MEAFHGKVFAFVEAHFDQLDTRSPAFAALSQETLHELLRSTKICSSEEKLFDALLLWVKQKPKDMQDRCLLAMLPLIRCSSLHLNFFYERLKNEQLIHPHSQLLQELVAGPRNPRNPWKASVGLDKEGEEGSERSDTNASDVSKDDWDDYKAQKWSLL